MQPYALPIASGVIQLISYDSNLYWEAVSLRDALLRKPLNLSFSDEQLKAEFADKHIAYVEKGKVMACLLLTPVDWERIKMRQVAVHERIQGRGIGRALVGYAEQYAKNKGFATVECHVRDTALKFYEKLGYIPVGEGFIEVNIPHFKMEKDL